MAFDPIATLREWKHKVASLQERWRGARLEIEQLRQENEKLRRREQQLEQREKQLDREQERLRQENERLKRQLEQAQRASKRQAAPFSRGTRKQNPKTPGCKSGSAYILGTAARGSLVGRGGLCVISHEILIFLHVEARKRKQSVGLKNYGAVLSLLVIVEAVEKGKQRRGKKPGLPL
jgi:exonuclease VII large subunit